MKIDHILQVLISLALIYFLLSTLVSIIFEWYAYRTKQRGKMLYQNITNLLDDPVNMSFGALIYSHPQIESLKKDKNSPPQYIAAGMFADAFIDVVGQQSIEISYVHTTDSDGNLTGVQGTELRESDPFKRFELGVQKMNYSPFKELLRSFHEKATTYEALKIAIGSWYDDQMERVSGWYKSKIRKALFYFALMVSLLLNIDSFRIIKTLNSDDELRKNLITRAEGLVNNKSDSTLENNKSDTVTRQAANNKDNFSVARLRNILVSQKLLNDSLDKIYIQQMDSALEVIESASLPIGWNMQSAPLSYFQKGSKNQNPIGGTIFWVLGILVSTFALSFGAPFWFDVLTNLVNIRRTGGKPDKISITQSDAKS